MFDVAFTALGQIVRMLLSLHNLVTFMLTQGDHPLHAPVCGLVLGALLGASPVALIGFYHLRFSRCERRRHWSRVADWLYSRRE